MQFSRALANRFKLQRKALTLRDKLRLLLYLSIRSLNFKRYRLLTKVESYLINGVRVCNNGLIYELYDAGTALLFENCYELKIRSWLYKNLDRDCVFIDVGAHIGLYTIEVSRICHDGLVVALEPNPFIYIKLLRNIKINHCNNVIPLNIAAWDREEKLKLYLADVSGRDSVIYKRPRYIEVRGMPLDKIVEDFLSKRIDRIDVVKIDVEGAELHVLKGMKRVLKKYKPYIIIEVSLSTLAHVVELLKGYSFTIIEGFNILAEP